MHLISDIGLLNDIIRNYFVKNTLTNNYLLSSAYYQYILKRKLFYIATSSNACILVEKVNFYQLYYYINDQNELLFFDNDAPKVLEVLYRGENQRPDEILSFWKKCGFRQHLTRDMMTASYGQLNIPGENKSDILIKYADTDYEICFSKKLIESTFDKYTGDILTLEEVLFYAREKNIICAYLGKDLAGILRFEIKNNLVWLQHIAVATQFRGNGIANALVKRYILVNRKHPETRYQLWVLTDNSKARTLYSKFGFIYGSKSSTSMLKD